MDIQGPFPCPQGPLAKTWARGRPPLKQWWVRGSKDHNEPSIKFRVWLSDHKCTLPRSSAADTMLCVLNLRIPPSECAGNRAKKASVHRSSTSNKVTRTQSLSSSTKLSPGNIATRAARTKVPAQVGCT